MEEYTESKQMYLKTILELQDESEKVRCVDIANKLGFSRPSVTNAVKKLKSDGLVTSSAETQIALTPLGLETAKKLQNRSVVLTSFLMGLGASKSLASETACKLEHVLSEDMFEIIKQQTKM